MRASIAVMPPSGIEGRELQFPSVGETNSRLRRLLLIAYHYPPSLESGALRPRGLVKYLAEFGWDVTVLTPRMQGARPGRVVETEHVDLLAKWKRRLRFNPERPLNEQLNVPNASAPNTQSLRAKAIAVARWMVTYPDKCKGWKPFGIAALEQLRSQPFDAIISTAPPLTCHAIAEQAKQVLHVPWVADFRDLWNVDEDNLEDRKGIVGALQRRTENRLLARCDALVTVSDPWAARLRLRYPTKPVHYITNGFDPDEIQEGEAKLTSKFSILHAGILYEGKRDPSLLLQVLRELIDSGEMNHSDLLLRFYGPMESFLAPLLKHYALDGVAEVRASVPRSEVLRLQRESQILLILSWSGPKENGGHTGKIFEYLAARRPVLACGGARGVMTELLEETHAGVHALSKEQLRHFLLRAYRDYKEQGRVRYSGNAMAMERYSQRGMARRFAEVLDNVASQKSMERRESVA